MTMSQSLSWWQVISLNDIKYFMWHLKSTSTSPELINCHRDNCNKICNVPFLILRTLYFLNLLDVKVYFNKNICTAHVIKISKFHNDWPLRYTVQKSYILFCIYFGIEDWNGSTIYYIILHIQFWNQIGFYW